MKRAFVGISSAKQAVAEAKAVKTIVAGDTWLSTRLLVYAVGLLEEIAASTRKRKATRKPSAWQLFMGQQLSKGRTVKEAAALWQSRKEAAAEPQP